MYVASHVGCCCYSDIIPLENITYVPGGATRGFSKEARLEAAIVCIYKGNIIIITVSNQY